MSSAVAEERTATGGLSRSPASSRYASGSPARPRRGPAPPRPSRGPPWSRGQLGGVVDVDGEALLDPLAQAADVAEDGVGGGADHETAGDRQARRGHLAEVRALAARVVDVLAGEVLETAEQSGGNWHQRPPSGSRGLVRPSYACPCVFHPRPAPVLGVWVTTDSPAFTTELPVFITEVSGLVVHKGSGVDPDEAHHKAGPLAGSNAAGGLRPQRPGALRPLALLPDVGGERRRDRADDRRLHRWRSFCPSRSGEIEE